jgi:ABC-type sugar transport system permease subunit
MRTRDEPAQHHETSFLDPWERLRGLARALRLAHTQVTLIYTLTGGGPLGRTETISVLAFKYAFTDWQLGYAAALGTSIFALNVLFVFAYLRVLRNPS